MENIQLHPTRKIVVPNDREAKTFFKIKPERYHRYITGATHMDVFEVKNHRKHGTIQTPVKLFIDPAIVAADPSVEEVLNQFDSDVANVCISEWEAGNRYVTYSTIYRTLTGKVGESDANPSKVQLARIKHSLKKLMNIRLEIWLYDVCEKFGYNNGEKKHIKCEIIPAQFVDCTVNGQKTRVIELTAESPLLTVARIKNNQIISYDVELLNVPNQKNTPLNIELKHYAIRRVMETIAHPKQMTPSITFDDVLAKCRIADADNKKKHRVRESLKMVFEHLVDCGVIDSFQVNKKKGVFYSISFTFGSAKRAKLEPANKVASKPAKASPSPQKSDESQPQEQSEEVTVAWSLEMPPAMWAMPITPSVHCQYRPNTLSITPWNTGIYAILQVLKRATLLLY